MKDKVYKTFYSPRDKPQQSVFQNDAKMSDKKSAQKDVIPNKNRSQYEKLDAAKENFVDIQERLQGFRDEYRR